MFGVCFERCLDREDKPDLVMFMGMCVFVWQGVCLTVCMLDWTLIIYHNKCDNLLMPSHNLCLLNMYRTYFTNVSYL